ncbi:MAG: transketolase family protein [Clostridia bacterium]|nr:transketolase family protein [Clostridia bacterium]
MTFVKDQNEMRKVYCTLLSESAKTDDRIVVLEADLMASNGTKDFFKNFPERAYNVGIAEANMIGVAAGLASCGKLPFANTFTAFATRRCYDQITISAAYTNLPLRVVGTDPGLAAEVNGGTHMSMEDVSIMRAMPNMAVFEPVDETQFRAAWSWITSYEGPLYIRLFRKNTTKIFDEGYTFEPGKVSVVKDGSDVVLFASGIMVAEALKAAEALAEEGINAAVVNVHTLKPFDSEGVTSWLKKCGAAVTAENGTVMGGLGSAVAECAADNYPVPVKKVGVQDHFGEVGTLSYLQEKYHMTAKDIVEAAKAAIAMKK